MQEKRSAEDNRKRTSSLNIYPLIYLLVIFRQAGLNVDRVQTVTRPDQGTWNYVSYPLREVLGVI